MGDYSINLVWYLIDGILHINIWNPDQDIKHFPVFVSIRILTKNVEVSNYNRDILCEWILGEYARGVKRELGNLVYTEIPRW